MKLLRLSAVSSFTASGLLFVTVALAAACGGAGSAPHRINIAVIPKGTSHVFWQSVHAGARRAAKSSTSTSCGAARCAKTIATRRSRKSRTPWPRRVRGIALAPLDESRSSRRSRARERSGVPVVIFDSGLKGDDTSASSPPTTTRAASWPASTWPRLLGGKGKVILLRYAEGHDSTQRREEGFLRGVARAPGHRDRSAAISMAAPTSKAPTSGRKRC